MSDPSPERRSADAPDVQGNGAASGPLQPPPIVWFGPDRSDGLITLASGRRVGVAQFGRASGVPVIWCHGGLSSRIDAALIGGAAARNGIRLIALDRPGIGRSSRRSDDGLLRWPAIVAECADHLRLDTFAVAGWSAGGAFALACAYLLPNRVSATATVAGIIPVDDPVRLRGLGLALDRHLIHASRRSPLAARIMLEPMRLAPDEVLWRSTLRTFGPAERRALVPETRPTVLRMLRESVRQGTAGVVADYRAFGTDWGFGPGVIRAPVTVFHGDADGLVPPSHAVRLAEALPAGTLVRVPDAGHFLHATHGELIMSSLRAATG